MRPSIHLCLTPLSPKALTHETDKIMVFLKCLLKVPVPAFAKNFLTLPPFAYQHTTRHYCLSYSAEMYHEVHKAILDFDLMRDQVINVQAVSREGSTAAAIEWALTIQKTRSEHHLCPSPLHLG